MIWIGGIFMNDKNITVYKILAWIGIMLMGVASFLACLGNTPAMVTAGNVILILSIIITTWGFTYWRP